MASKIKSEDLRLNIIVGDGKAKKELQDLQKSIESANQKVDSLNKSYQQAVKRYGEASSAAKKYKTELDSAKTSLEANKKKHSELTSAISLESKSLNELQRHLKATRLALGNATPGTENFKRLSNEVSNTTARIKELKGQSQETGNILERFSSKGDTYLSAIGAYTAVAGTVLKKYFEILRDSTQESGDTVKRELADIKASFDVFKKALATNDFSGFINGIHEASAAAKQLYDILDEAFERENSIILQRGSMNVENAVLLENLRNQKLTLSERIEAGRQYLANMEGIYSQEIELTKDVADAQLEMLFASTNRTKYANNEEREAAKQKLADYILEYNLSKDNIKQAKEYLDLRRQYDSLSRQNTGNKLQTMEDIQVQVAAATTYEKRLRELSSEMAKYGDEVREILPIVEQYGLTADTDVQAYVEAQMKFQRAQSAMADENRRYISQINSLEAQLLGNQKKAAEERELLAKREKKTRDEITKATEDSITNTMISISKSIETTSDAVASVKKAQEEIGDTERKTGIGRKQDVSELYEDLLKLYRRKEKDVADSTTKSLIESSQARAALLQMVALSGNEALWQAVGAKNQEEATAMAEDAKQYAINVVDTANKALKARGSQLSWKFYAPQQSWTLIAPESGSDPSGSTGGGSDNNPKGGGQSWSLSSDRDYQKARLELLKKFNDGEIKSKEEFDYRISELELMTYERRLSNTRMSAKDRLSIETSYQEALKKNLETFSDSVKESDKKLEEDRKKKAEDDVKVRTLLNTVAAAEAKLQNDLNGIRDAALEAENIRYEKEVKTYEEKVKKYGENAKEKEAIERQHRINLDKIQLEAFDRQLADIDKEHKQQRAAIEASYADELAAAKKGSGKEIDIRRRMNKELLDADMEFLQAEGSLLAFMKRDMDFLGVALTEDQLAAYQKKLDEVQKSIGDTKSAIKETNNGMMSGAGGGTMFGVSQSDWEQFFANIGDSTMAAKNLETAMKAIGDAAKQGFSIAEKAIKLTADKEKAALKEWEEGNEKKKNDLALRLQDGLMTQAQYDAEIKAMEEEKAAREEEMKLKQAKRQKAMQLSQAIINTAVSVTQTLAQWGLPWGAIPAALALAMGAVEIGLIASTPIESFGAAEGGLVETKRKQDGKRYPARLSPDKRGFISSPTILVGEDGGEYVIPSEGLENPNLVPFINTLEFARRNGTLRNLRLEAFQPYVVSATRASGGPTASDFTTPVITMDPRMVMLMEKIMYRLDNPIAPEIPIAGSRGLRSQLDRYEAQRQRGRVK